MPSVTYSHILYNLIFWGAHWQLNIPLLTLTVYFCKWTVFFANLHYITLLCKWKLPQFSIALSPMIFHSLCSRIGIRKREDWTSGCTLEQMIGLSYSPLSDQLEIRCPHSHTLSRSHLSDNVQKMDLSIYDQSRHKHTYSDGQSKLYDLYL